MNLNDGLAAHGRHSGTRLRPSGMCALPNATNGFWLDLNWTTDNLPVVSGSYVSDARVPGDFECQEARRLPTLLPALQNCWLTCLTASKTPIG